MTQSLAYHKKCVLVFTILLSSPYFMKQDCLLYCVHISEIEYSGLIHFRKHLRYRIVGTLNSPIADTIEEAKSQHKTFPTQVPFTNFQSRSFPVCFPYFSCHCFIFFYLPNSSLQTNLFGLDVDSLWNLSFIPSSSCS